MIFLIILILVIFVIIYNKDTLYKILIHRKGVSEQFEKHDPNENKNELILYHTTHCIHCRNIMPIWDEFTKKNIVKCSKVNCDDGKCSNINGFPTIHLMTNNKKIIYNGNRTVEDFTNFCRKNMA